MLDTKLATMIKTQHISFFNLVEICTYIHIERLEIYLYIFYFTKKLKQYISFLSFLKRGMHSLLDQSHCLHVNYKFAEKKVLYKLLYIIKLFVHEIDTYNDIRLY